MAADSSAAEVGFIELTDEGQYAQARVEGLADLRLLPRRPTGEHIVAAGRCGGGGGPEEAGEDDEREPQVPHVLRIGVRRPASHSRERVGGIPDLRCFAWTSL